ncbi:MAG: hydroxyphenylacetyl-CoA thioesterase PaaI [Dethiobacter sp.]|jgi:acyl-CoA thioesterase|nr:hydroxyphenylacetyl-CoA thioesterase PaaI [Dethiobacter sp.]
MDSYKPDLPDNTREIKAKYAADTFPQKMGIKLVELTPGYARVEVKVTEDMLNFHNIAHGGAIFTLADTAFGLASNSRGPAVALQVSINFISAVDPGTVIFATAVEEQLTRKTGIYNITVASEEGKTVALFRGVVYRKKQ